MEQQITIVDYKPEYQQAFRAINVQWISHYFDMEEGDYKALDHPQEYILDPGGHILVAVEAGKPIGVCALLKMEDPEYDFELVKMGVAPEARGKGVGWMLGQAAIEKARELSDKKLYIESNRVLAPAIRLYQKLGFKEIFGRPSPYARCDIQMELEL